MIQNKKIQVMTDESTKQQIEKYSKQIQLSTSAFCRMATLKEIQKMEAVSN